MRIIISPAKRMKADTDSLPPESMPAFLREAEALKLWMQGMEGRALQSLWRCNDAIAALNVERLRTMDLQRNLTPAILSYEGIQYQYMAPGVFERGHFAYINERLRILSGFYGLLRPFDGVTPHRLEMGARLPPAGCKDLYAYWGDKPARRLAGETDVVLNLASGEYGKAVIPHLPGNVRIITCTFGERMGGRILEKGTICKMARGQMVRFLAESGAANPEDAKHFDRLEYAYCENESSPDNYVFIRRKKR